MFQHRGNTVEIVDGPAFAERGTLQHVNKLGGRNGAVVSVFNVHGLAQMELRSL